MSSSAALAQPLATPAVKRTGTMRVWLNERIAKGRSKVFTEKLTVTPEIARMLLETNKDNRKLRPAKLQQLKSDMSGNRFMFNGEPIIIADTGELNDGQHRLTAIVETNKAQDMLLVFGVHRDTRTTIDTGAARSAGDHLSITGWPYASAISSVARNVIGFQKSKEKFIGKLSDISSAEVLDKAVGDKLLQECASYIAQQSGKYAVFGKQGVIGFLYYEFAKRRPLEAKTFIDKLRTGTDLPENSPIHILRQHLLLRPKLSPVERIEIIVRAWNAWIKDTPIKQLRFMAKLPPIEG